MTPFDLRAPTRCHRISVISFCRVFPAIVRYFVLCLLLLAMLTIPAQATPSATADLLHLLDYIGVDYPSTIEQGHVVVEAEYAEQVEFAERVISLTGELPEGELKPTLQQEARALQQAIVVMAPGAQIGALTQTMQQQVVDLTGVSTAPRRAPDLAEGRELFQSHCASCHGMQGRGDGPQASGLTPPPINFLDRSRQDKRSLYGLYNTITRGVAKTAMRGFTELSEAQRWALAFYTGSLPFLPAEIATGKRLHNADTLPALIPDLASLTSLTVVQIRKQAGKEGVTLLAYLRTHPGQLMSGPAALNKARRLLTRSLEAYQSGHSKEAYRLAVAAYLDGFETAEVGLRNLNTTLVDNVERAMSAYRTKLKEHAPLGEVQSTYQAVDNLLVRARQLLATTSLTPGMTFISAMVILLREGLEALLVLAAILALLIKADRREALPWIHFGWVSALAMGGVTWWVSQYVVTISGASREVTEGVTALLATTVLLYVGFWLHSKTHAKQWQKFLQEKIHGALQGKALWGLSGMAFLAVYREVFETVLFYEALAQQTDPANGSHMLWGGLLTGALLLGVIAWLLMRTSLRLPLRLFFNVNAMLLCILAIIFTGRGIAALQEAGVLSSVTLNLPQVSWLGVYPTVETLLGQLLVISLIGGLFVYERYRA